ncbi:GrpB family protein [Paractinoplanes maris]|uniref:GrpB family protein n=1 Tax=Paractinoplanes maris TaxID=1734446 RepID=UPI002022495B|nr:GrpB family protein [Actinoplanes maris]
MTEYPPEITQRLLGTPEQNASGLVGEWPRRWSSIVIEDYDPGWVERYADARAAIVAALGERVVGLEHVGSTSVPGLAAKPVIDIDLLLADSAEESVYVPPLAPLGYRLLLREPWWYGHRMLIGGDDDIHLHVWPRDAPEPIRHRLLRDWLRTHPEDRDLYADTKRRLAREQSSDYTMAKSDVIDQIFARIFAQPNTSPLS